jgi:hypothetical protein
MKIKHNNSSILDSKPVEMGFIVGKYDDPEMYAAIPMSGSDVKLMIIHQGSQLKVCRNRQSALNFIEQHKKKSKQKTGTRKKKK